MKDILCNIKDLEEFLTALQSNILKAEDYVKGLKAEMDKTEKKINEYKNKQAVLINWKDILVNGDIENIKAIYMDMKKKKEITNE